MVEGCRVADVLAALEVPATGHLGELDSVDWPRLRDGFLASGGWEPDGVVALYNAVRGVARAVTDAGLGLLFDHREAHLVAEVCNELVDERIGRPDEYWSNPESYVVFDWDGTSVHQGLVAFDQWLVQDQASHNEREGTDLQGYRLVEIDTGADAYLAMLVLADLVDEAVRRLSHAGFRARRLGVADEACPLRWFALPKDARSFCIASLQLSGDRLRRVRR
jgi:hypothetical protein